MTMPDFNAEPLLHVEGLKQYFRISSRRVLYMSPSFVSFYDTHELKKIVKTSSADRLYLSLIRAISPCVNSAPFL